MTQQRRRRQAGEGGISEYRTKAGPQYLIKYSKPNEDGTTTPVLRRRGRDGRPFLTRKAATAELGDIMAEIRKGAHVVPTRITVAQHFTEWLDGLDLGSSTVASYRKNVRLHVLPHIGAVRLDALTGTRLTKLYRQLEQDGRADGKGGLSARTVRYIHTIVHSALGAAVEAGLLAHNPADKSRGAKPPSAKRAKPPEMHPWDSGQLNAFLEWSRSTLDALYVAWRVLGYTGMRRGEALALQWRDVDSDAGMIRVRRAAKLIKEKGEPERIEIGDPKSGNGRPIDLDEQTLAALKAYRASRAELSLDFARPTAWVFGTLAGEVRHPERFSRTFKTRVGQARRALGEDTLPDIHLHDLRHSHATILLGELRQPVKVVQERLGHASPTITLTVYAHVMPGQQRAAADQFAALISGGPSA